MEPKPKLYYDINEVAEILKVQPSAIRFWEKKFPQLAPKRDARNRRRFTERDLEVLRKIMHQRVSQKRTIEGTREQMNRKEQAELLVQRLLRVKQFLVELRDKL